MFAFLQAYYLALKMATGGCLLITEEKSHYLRYWSLLNDGGKLVLLQQLKDQMSPNDISVHLQINRKNISDLHRRHLIFDSQYDLLFPSTWQADSSKFDITLLTCLLRSTCNLNTHSSVWDARTPPVDTDISVEADVARLRNLRNQVCCIVSVYYCTLLLHKFARFKYAMK